MSVKNTLYMACLILLALSYTSCSKKTGCPINEEQSAIVIDKNGRTKKTKTRTFLFDPKAKKKNKKS